MGSFSLFHWFIVAAIILLLFGRGRIADVMGDFGKGISSFKKGMVEVEKETAPKLIPAQQPVPTAMVSGAPSTRTPDEQAAAKREPSG